MSRKVLTRRPVRASMVALATGAVAMGIVAPGAANAAVTVPGPAKLQVARTGADSTDLKITWSAVAKADHYTVNVFDGKKDVATVVAKDQTSFVYDGSGNCTRYQVRVSAAYDNGAVGRTGLYYVSSLAPGAVSDVKWDAGKLTWGQPKLPGATPVTGYEVQVKKISTGEVVHEVTTKENSAEIPAVESTRSYVAKVVAVNEFGTCSSAATQIRGTSHLTDAPMGLRIRRDEGTPTRVIVTWDRPAWANAEGVTGYRIYTRGHGHKGTDHRDVGPDVFSTEFTLEADKNYDFQIRALGAGKNGKVTKPVVLSKLGKATSADSELDPEIKITESGSNVVVDINGTIGSAKKYTELDVRIAPTLSASGFHDKQLASNASTQITFGPVPCGVFTVVVTGQGKSASKEFGRLYLNRCDQNVIPANQWKLIHGQAAISGNSVSFPKGGESRVISTVPRSSGDMVFTTQANLSAGWGYGIWTRAKFDNSGVSGYSFQYDPGFARVSSFGPALLLRVWNNGRECGNPIAKVKWPSGVEVNATHNIVVVAQGDSLYASIDGKRLFEVASLKQALTDSKCGFAEPTGTQVGFRVWNSETRASFENTTLN